VARTVVVVSRRPTTPSHVHHDEPFGRAVVSIYGAVAALIRDDAAGARLLMDDLRLGFEHVAEPLVALSFVTLEQMQVTFDPALSTEHPAPTAGQLIDEATAFGVAPGRSVHAAAWRLDAVRRCDGRKVRRDLRASHAAGDADELVAGAVSLLAAVVAAGARRRGEPAGAVTRDLCLAAVLEHAA
jgi:hypothetical protein